MTRVRIFPYNPGSRSARTLSERMEAPRLRTVGSRFRPRANDVVINWGSTRCPDFSPARVLNKRQSIMDASNKLITFGRLDDAGVNIPNYWGIKASLPPDVKIVARTVLNGHSGQGIVIGKREELPECQLYTQYIGKQEEYRVHVVGGKAIFGQRKARKLENENPNWEVRNLAGGFVYVACETGPALNEIAVKAIAALGLDFGAVDVIMARSNGALYVLEVNTACGLEERTADKYATAFKEMLSA